jgi:hypothetical protein
MEGMPVEMTAIQKYLYELSLGHQDNVFGNINIVERFPFFTITSQIMEKDIAIMIRVRCLLAKN